MCADMSDKTSAEMRADPSSAGRDMSNGDFAPGSSWPVEGDWDSYYSIGLLLTRK